VVNAGRTDNCGLAGMIEVKFKSDALLTAGATPLASGVFGDDSGVCPFGRIAEGEK